MPPPRSTPKRAARSPVRRRTRTPAAVAESVPTIAPEAELHPLSKRPQYFSDDDTRPYCRGAWYWAIRKTGIAWLVLGAYACFALWDARNGRPLLQLCRLLHTVALVLNVLLSDGLHNLDRHLGSAYLCDPDVSMRERVLHARDWRAALAVPASYNVLLVFGIMDWQRVGTEELALLGANLAAYALMYVRISAERISPKRELFLSFVLTFATQMVILLVAFYRQRDHHKFWFPLWFVYAIGLVAKALEFPDSKYFGHHEVPCLRAEPGLAPDPGPTPDLNPILDCAGAACELHYWSHARPARRRQYDGAAAAAAAPSDRGDHDADLVYD